MVVLEFMNLILRTAVEDRFVQRYVDAQQVVSVLIIAIFVAFSYQVKVYVFMFHVFFAEKAPLRFGSHALTSRRQPASIGEILKFCGMGVRFCVGLCMREYRF